LVIVMRGCFGKTFDIALQNAVASFDPDRQKLHDKADALRKHGSEVGTHGEPAKSLQAEAFDGKTKGSLQPIFGAKKRL
jgi:hypothetical protein